MLKRSPEDIMINQCFRFHSVAVLVGLFLLANCWSVELPQEVQRLRNQKNNAVERVNDKYSRELEKIKLRYTKKGNLEVALAIEKEIKSLGGEREGATNKLIDLVDPLSLAGEYNYNYIGNDYKETWVLTDDMKAKFFKFRNSDNPETGNWRVENGELLVKKGKLSYTFDLRNFVLVSTKIVGSNGTAKIQKKSE